MFYPQGKFCSCYWQLGLVVVVLNLGETTEGDVAEFPEIVDDGGGGVADEESSFNIAINCT